MPLAASTTGFPAGTCAPAKYGRTVKNNLCLDEIGAVTIRTPTVEFERGARNPCVSAESGGNVARRFWSETVEGAVVLFDLLLDAFYNLLGGGETGGDSYVLSPFEVFHG